MAFEQADLGGNDLQLGVTEQNLQIAATIGKMNLSVEPNVARR